MTSITCHENDKPKRAVPNSASLLVGRHLHLGWWCLLGFLTLGIVLETFHGFKVGWYMDVSNETRRLMWTLAHTHGTLLGILHIAFAVTVLAAFTAGVGRGIQVASSCLILSGFCMPTGFFLGGVVIYDGDPGLGILLVPIGGILLFVAVLLTALGVRSALRERTRDDKSIGHE